MKYIEEVEETRNCTAGSVRGTSGGALRSHRASATATDAGAAEAQAHLSP